MVSEVMMTAVEGPAEAASGVHDFDRLFREEGSGVYRTLYAFTGGRRQIAEEAAAEAFARAIAHAANIREPLPWIYRTAFRIAASELKKEKRPSGGDDGVVDAPEGMGDLIAALR